MNIKKVLCSAVVLLLISISSVSVFATGIPRYEECNYCSSDASFRSHAAFISNNYYAGNYDVSIINKNTFEIWHVEVNVETIIGFGSPDEGGLGDTQTIIGLDDITVTLGVSYREDQAVIDDIKYLFENLSVTIVIDSRDYTEYNVQTVGLCPTSNCIADGLGRVNTWMRGLDIMRPYAQANLFKRLFGSTIKLNILLFSPDHSSMMFEFVNSHGPTVTFNALADTAVDANGIPINSDEIAPFTAGLGGVTVGIDGTISYDLDISSPLTGPICKWRIFLTINQSTGKVTSAMRMCVPTDPT